ncbi:MAG: hypothetical protein BMS9Abin10_0973 [Gammaproteobacteria bacterium]|nr:MAG: hypothetical protein BMS9Abin10_0973 [Gammaproteobacteria bacterium]
MSNTWCGLGQTSRQTTLTALQAGLDRMTTKILGYLLLAIIVLGATPLAVHAVKLYKWVDEEGRVTYQDKPPPPGTDEVKEKTINPDEGVTEFTKPKPSEPGVKSVPDQGGGSVAPATGERGVIGGGEGRRTERRTGVAPTPPPPPAPAVPARPPRAIPFVPSGRAVPKGRN